MGEHRAPLVPSSRFAPTFTAKLLRASDRLITPATVVGGMVCVVLLVALTVAGELYAQRHGYPAGEVIDTVTKTLTALGTLAGAFYLRGQRHQMSRVESGVNRAVNTPSE